MGPSKNLNADTRDSIEGLGNNPDLQALTKEWMRAVAPYKYVYNFSWLGRPIIQFPQDIVAAQELAWIAKPDLIIETGIAHGGSLIMSASMLVLLDYCDAVLAGKTLDPARPGRKVIGIDIDIREHNRSAIEAHPLASRIEIIQGSSISAAVIAEVRRRTKGVGRVLVILDSNHTHEHVLAELEAYAPLVTPGSYCVVSDTEIEDMPANSFPDRSWNKGNNPKTAVWEFFRRLREEGRADLDGRPLNFEIDKSIEHKLLITVAPDGYLKRVA